MARPEEPDFDRVAEQFIEGYATQVNGYVRYQVVRANLAAKISALAPNARGGPRRIIDIGAGDGTDSRWLAGMGHGVVAVDPSSKMVEAAKKHRTPELEDILQGDATTALGKYGEGSFDGVLSHGVMPYMADPGQHVHELSQLVGGAGFISLLTKGFNGTLLRYANERKFDGMRDYIKTGRYIVNRLGEDATAYRPEQVERFLSNEGFRLLGWFGVNIISDSLEEKADQTAQEDLDLLVEQELALSRDPNSRGMGQLLHFVGFKLHS